MGSAVTWGTDLAVAASWVASCVASCVARHVPTSKDVSEASVIGIAHLGWEKTAAAVPWKRINYPRSLARCRRRCRRHQMKPTSKFHAPPLESRTSDGKKATAVQWKRIHARCSACCLIVGKCPRVDDVVEVIGDFSRDGKNNKSFNKKRSAFAAGPPSQLAQAAAGRCPTAKKPRSTRSFVQLHPGNLCCLRLTFWPPPRRSSRSRCHHTAAAVV